MQNRRTFLQRMAGVGALIATSQLPSFAQDDPTVFPKRGQFERMSMSYAIVHLGLERPFSVLHISDSHLTAAYSTENEKKQELHKKRTITFGGRQEEALRDALAWAKQHVEFIVHTGDLIDWQSQENFDLVRKYFGDALQGQGLFGCMGNHEFTTDMWLSDPKEEHTEAYKDNTRKVLQQTYPFDISFQSQVVHGVNFITLDDVYGYVTAQQVERFHQEVKRGLPIVLCMHVPFHTDNTWRATKRYWGGKAPLTDGKLPPITGDYKIQQEDPVTRDFIAELKHQPLLRCILAGHEHITFEDQFSPWCRQYIVAGGFLFHGQEVMFI